MTSYISKLNIFHLLLCLALFGVACDKTENNMVLNAEVQLSSFTVNGEEGNINQHTGEIAVNLPFGTALDALIPELGLPAQASSFPEQGQAVNFTGPVNYRIVNGNLYKDYSVSVNIIPPIQSFRINGQEAVIDHPNRTITLMLPDGADLSALQAEVELAEGISISPDLEGEPDYSTTVPVTFTRGTHSVVYQVNVISSSISEYAFLGMAASREGVINPDEKAAADWFFTTYPEAEYISFQSIETGRKLSNYKVIWWHYDAAQDLPAEALTPAVVDALKGYRAAGGSLLLTTFATQYVEVLGVVPAGRGPNNVFGDFLPNGFIDHDSDWGISFRGREEHPVFEGLDTYEGGKAYLLGRGTFRLNHTAWWFLPEWGGYGDGAGWRAETGGINLASEAWDDHLDGRVGIAEWPSTTGAGNVVIIAFGAYDWYSEPQSGASTNNAYIHNIRRLTRNTIDYLKNNN